MATNALLGVLESTVGKYVQGLDAKSLNVAVWSGKIELSGLKLDVDAVNDELGRRARAAPNLALPIRVCDGRFDTLKIEVPWARIASRPVVIKAAGFEVTVEPYDHLQGVTDLAAKKRKEVRKDEIVRADEDRKRRNALWKINLTDIDGGGSGSDSPSGPNQRKSKAEQDAGFTANLIRRIIENLQIEIESFHVSLRGCGAQAGVVLGGLSIATTNEHGVKTFVDRTVVDKNTGTRSKFLFKSLSMNGLGLYVDATMSPSLLMAQGRHSFVLAPMNFEASVRQSDHEGHKMFPKYQVKSKIPQLAAALSRTQLELTNQITAALAPNRNVVRPLFPEYRPTSDILQGGAKDWWRYAVRAIGRLNRRRSWAELFIAYRKRKRYIPLYMRASSQDTHKWIKPLSAHERAVLEAIEQDPSISTEGIMMWRNISDAQVEQEDRLREEHFIQEMIMGGPGDMSLDSPPRGSGGRPSLRSSSGRKSSSSIFMSARMVLSEDDLMDDAGNDGVAPITLTANELREIEEVMFEKEDASLSSDSKLYDLTFELSEFTVDLIYQGRLASLRMGKAAAEFKAAADGSFEFGFAMQSLVVDDHSTTNTLFPSIIRSLESPSSSSSLNLAPSSTPASSQDAFKFRLEKNRLGDQLLKVKMVAFEIVASQNLIRGIKDFFTFGPAQKTSQGGVSSDQVNASFIKTQSGEDLFYDAAEHHHLGDEDGGRGGVGGGHNLHDNIVGMTADAAHAAAAAVSDALATSIVDAWNAKRDEKRAWSCTFDLHAPLLVLPESCTSATATTIVADLGRFIVVFGTNAMPPPKVKAWFDERAANDEEKPSVDFCTLELRDFRCLLGTAGNKDWTKPALSADDKAVSFDKPNSWISSKAIVEPLSLSFCIGFESSADKGDDAGTCLMGVLPSIAICASMPQIYDMLSVISTWSTFFGTLGSADNDTMDAVAATAASDMLGKSTEMAEDPMIDLSQVTKQYLTRIHGSRVGDNEKLYLELSLKRISVKLLTHRGDGIEAHLVSIVATSRVLDDGCTSSTMKMGYVWIFDGLRIELPREQRLIAHSALPLSSETFAKENYNVMECLERLGVFNDNYGGASDLAEVTLSTSPETLTTTIDGTFSSLFLNFNPLVIWKIIDDITRAPDSYPSEEGGVADLGQSFSQDMISQGWSYVQDEQKDTENAAKIGSGAPADKPETEQQGSLHITAKMGGLEILTRSPSDDSVLLRFAAITSELSYKSSAEEATAEIKLNNLIIEDQRMLSLRPDFRYILIQGSVDEGLYDRFLISYRQCGSAMDVNVNLGSPEIVLPSDVLVDVLEFWVALFPPVATEEGGIDPQPSKEMLLAVPSDISASDIHDKADSSTSDHHVEDIVPDSNMTVQVTSGSTCKVVLVDVGAISSGAGADIAGRKPQANNASTGRLSDCVVVQGGVAVTMKMTGGSHVSSDYELTWSDMQAFTARGSNFHSPIQMLDPSELSAVYRTSMREDVDETEIKLWSLKSIDFTVSMEDLALMLAILSSFGDAFAASPSDNDGALQSGTEEDDDDDAKVIATKVLTAKEADRINRLSLALNEAIAVELTDLEEEEEDDDRKHRNVAENNRAVDEACGHETIRTAVAGDMSAGRRASSMKIKIAFPETTLTIINDLNGLDEGLFKLYVSDFLVSGEVQYPSWLQRHTTSSVPLLPGSDRIKPALKFELNQVLTANYFDTHSSLWEPLLLQPFETNLSALRSPSHNHPGSKRLQSTINIDLDPCHISFSEKFLVSLGAASRMWGSYSFATSEAAVIESSILASNKVSSTKPIRDRRAQRNSSLLVRKSTAAIAARSFVTSLPFRVENRSGMVIYFDLKGEEETHICENGANEYFRFDPPKGKGVGGKRAYGQNVTEFHTLTLRVGDRSIQFRHLDAYLNLPTQTHELDSGRRLFTRVLRKGRATCLVLSSSVSIYNCTSSLDFRIRFQRGGETSDLGVAERDASRSGKSEVSELSNEFGIPISLLSHYDGSEVPSIEIDFETKADGDETSSGNSNSECKVIFSPILGREVELVGTFDLPSPVALIEMGEGVAKVSEITCRSVEEVATSSADTFAVRLVYTVAVVGGHPLLNICLHPRAIIENRVPLHLLMKTSQSFTFSSYSSVEGEEETLIEGDRNEREETCHSITPLGEAEIYSANAFLSTSIKIKERPVDGNTTGWSQEVLKLPLDNRIHTPVQAILPFLSQDDSSSPLISHPTGGDHLFILEQYQLAEFTAVEDENSATTAVSKSQAASNIVRRITIVAMNFAIDHTGNLLLQDVDPRTGRKDSAVGSFDSLNGTFVATRGAYALPGRKARLILIPSPDTLFKLVPSKLKPPDADGFQLGSTFRVKDVTFCGGGVQSSAILWDKSKIVSSFFAYRKFSSFGQTEIHLIPEFVVFNGSGSFMRVKEKGGRDVSIAMNAEDIEPWIMPDRARGLKLAFQFPSIGGNTDGSIRLDEIGSKVLVVRNESGGAIGSISVQTEPGHSDSRLVIKVSALKLSGGDASDTSNDIKSEQLFTGDFFRFRARLTELQVTLKDTQKSEARRGSIYDRNKAAIESAFDIKASEEEEVELAEGNAANSASVGESDVAQIIFERFTCDFQRIFKATPKAADSHIEASGRGGIDDADAIERSQLAVILSSFQIRDCTEDARYPLIFDSSDTTASFLDLCIRLRGSFDQPLVHLECFDLNISCVGGKANTITIKTDERFLWKMLDILNRIFVATADLAGVDMHLEFDEATGEYEVSTKKVERTDELAQGRDYEAYEISPSEKLYDIAIVRVSPMKLIVSFLREPDASRYGKTSGVIGARAINYFTTKMTFTVDRANLSFAGYAARHVKGALGQIISMLSSFYISRLKRKAFSLLTAVSLNDWNYLTSRDDGNEGYVEGDLLRLTGNVAGRGAGLLLKRVGQGVDEGLRAVTGGIGTEIQNAAEFVGVGVVGEGVNSALTGLGEGVGSAVKGTGHGAGKLVRGAVVGVGQAAGGVVGGVGKAAKGVISGDANAALEGASSAAYGVGQGVETIVTGTADGVRTVGVGFTDGIKNILRGLFYCCIDGSTDGSEHGSSAR